MVDSIGWKAARPVERVAGVMPVAGPRPAAQAGTDQAAATGTTSTAQMLAAAPPVDVDRVSRIKKAIADGRFPIVPSTIADRLLALKLEWNPNDKA